MDEEDFSAYPQELTIAVTDRCNMRCAICNRDWYEEFIGGKGSFLPLENLDKILGAVARAEVVGLTGFGEPLLHPEFKRIVEKVCAANARPALLDIITNGTLLRPETIRLLAGRMRSFVVSVNAATAEEYRRATGRDLAATLGRLESAFGVLDDADRSRVKLSFVAHGENYREIPAFVRLAHGLGVGGVNISHYMVNHAERLSLSLLPVMEDYNRMVEEAEHEGARLGIPVSARRFLVSPLPAFSAEEACDSPFRECFVHVDGTVVPCCYVGEPANLGNVYAESFEAVWFGQKYTALRRRRYLLGCKRCSKLAAFEEMDAHLHPAFKWLYTSEKCWEMLDVPTRQAISRARVIRSLGMDWGLLQAQARLLGLVYAQSLERMVRDAESRGQPLETEPIRDDLRRASEAAFRSSPNLPMHTEIDLTRNFLGFGWGAAECNVMGQRWRWLGASGESSLYLVLPPTPGKLRVYIHSAPPEVINALRAQVDGRLDLPQGVCWEEGTVYFWVELGQALEAQGERRCIVRLLLDAASNPGGREGRHVNFTRAVLGA